MRVGDYARVKYSGECVNGIKYNGIYKLYKSNMKNCFKLKGTIISQDFHKDFLQYIRHLPKNYAGVVND